MKKLLLCFAVAAVGLTGTSYAQMTQDFEGSATALPTGWVNNVIGMGNGWEVHSGGDLTISAAASAIIPSHTNFAYVNDQAAHNNYPAKMESASFNAPSGAYLVFDVWFRQYYLNSTPYRREIAWIEYSSNGGSTWTFLDSIKAYGGNWITKGTAITTPSTTAKVRFCYSDQRIATSTDTAGIIGIGVDNIKVYVPPTNEIKITQVTPVTGNPINDFKVVGGAFTFGGTVYNNGSTTVTGFNAGFKVGSSAAVTGAVSGLSIAPFTSGTFTCTGSYTAVAGTQSTKVFVNLTGDADQTNDTLGTSVTGVSAFPTKRPFFEEPTGTWCGFCVRGLVYMDSIWKAKKGLVSVVSVHNSDPMQAENSSTTKYDALMGNYIGGYPALVSDRMNLPNMGDPSDVFDAFNYLTTWYGFADVKAIASVSGSNVNVTAKVTPTAAMSGDYRLELIVTEDRVHGTSSSWDQSNYYSGGSRGPLQNTEYNFVTLPSHVPAAQMYYDFVARTTIPADLTANPNGVAGSLPSTLPAGTTQSYTFASVPVASNWVANKLRGIVLLIDNNPTSITYGIVLNSASTIWYVGVENVTAGIKGGRIFPNPASNEANLIFDLENDANVSISVYDAVGRMMYSKNQKMGAGEQHETLNVADFAAGIYNVVIATENGSVTERFSVAK